MFFTGLKNGLCWEWRVPFPGQQFQDVFPVVKCGNLLCNKVRKSSPWQDHTIGDLSAVNKLTKFGEDLTPAISFFYIFFLCYMCGSGQTILVCLFVHKQKSAKDHLD